MHPVFIAWHHQPIVRILIPFSTGILFDFTLSAQVILIFVWLVLLLIWLSEKQTIRTFSFHMLMRGCLMLLLIFLFGLLFNVIQKNDLDASNRFFKDGKENWLLVKIHSEPVLKKGKYRFDAKIIAVSDSTSPPKNLNISSGIIKVNYHSSKTGSLTIGDWVFIRGIPKIPNESAIPGNFNFREALRKKGIYYILSVKDNHLIKTDLNNAPLLKGALGMRKYFIQKLEGNGLKGNELSVTSALIFGDRAEIDEEIISDFKGSGLIHILAVSGLHVGLIYGAALFLLQSVIQKKHPLIKLCFLVILIWIYAFITGLSPSVVRASLMFSLIATGESLHAKISPFNMIASSALIMLMIDPFIWRDIGFQLSFGAVWGIITFSPVLTGLKQIPNPLFRYILISIGVSISAQLATSMLGLYHFGTFPVYFLISNLIAVPLSTILTYWGLAAVVLADMNWVGDFLAFCLGKGIIMMNKFASWVNDWPNSQLCGYYINEASLLISILILFQISFLVQRFSYPRLMILLCFILIFSFYSFVSTISTQSDNYYLIFRHKNQVHLVISNKGKAIHRIYAYQRELHADIHNDLRNSLAKCLGIRNFSEEYWLEPLDYVSFNKEGAVFSSDHQGIKWKKIRF